MSKYDFYYDESEHSRRINYETISASNYYDNFVTMIVGWESGTSDVLQRHTVFEEKYADRKDCNGELKSTTLHQKQYQYGFASMNRQNAELLNDFLSLFDEDTHIYFSISSKIEYLVLQLFRGYHNSLLVDADMMKYSIIKALVVYRPKEIIKCIYESPKDFLEQLKAFFRIRIEENKSNPELKQAETNAFQEILVVLGEVSEVPELNWDYHMPFDGFKRYMQEKSIREYTLIIDKEGKEDEASKTLKAAHEIGLNSAVEADSMEYQGLRLADMLAGIISKLLKALCDSLHYRSVEDGINRKILDVCWFKLNEGQLNLYKKLYRIICEWQPAWYKSFSGIYSDDLVVFNALLNYMNHFETVEQIKADIEMQGEYLNALACKHLEEYFERRRCKLPFEPVIPFDEESFLNQRGGKVYFDSQKQPLLQLRSGCHTFNVLSVGMAQGITPSVTVLQNGKPMCYRLPDDLSEWVCCMVAMAAMGVDLFPSKVTFSNINGKYYADIL